jgi:hypothetical protein
MDDPKTIRLNDADRPDRRDRFEQCVKRTAANGNEIIRRLIDAWISYVDQHGHSPTFPVTLMPTKPGRK